MEKHEKVTYIFDTLTELQIPLRDFSAVVGISRTSLHRWKRGGNIVNVLLLDVAFSASLRLRKAREQGLLPFTERLKTKQRQRRLLEILREMK